MAQDQTKPEVTSKAIIRKFQNTAAKKRDMPFEIVENFFDDPESEYPTLIAVHTFDDVTGDKTGERVFSPTKEQL
jgi:hypothetical protein